MCEVIYQKRQQFPSARYLQESNLGLELELWLTVSTEPWEGCVCVHVCARMLTLGVRCVDSCLYYFGKLSGEVALLLEMMPSLTVAAGSVRMQGDE